MKKKKKQKKKKKKSVESKPLPSRVRKLFDRAKAKYTALSHRIVYTAFDLAATLHIPLVDVVKTLLIKTEGGYALVLLSAAHRLDIKKFSRATGAKKVSIPPEKEIVRRCKIKKGPLASFGSFYKLPVHIDRALVKRKKALFSLGSFQQSVLLPVKDFLTIERPTIGVFHARRKG
ncbi:YbaK/EbsC family protein [Candidatus Uhrbacteria bacterium]|nr:YbaK/EbsC family protein [Candidatus Uhrbacteria bacterium]